MNKKTVLIIEDEKKLARLLQDYLEQAGYATYSLHNGNQVLPWLTEHPIDLIILDVMLPGTDGITLCDNIRKTSTVPIIMASAKVTEDDRLTGLITGADDYLCKPYSLREMVARVQALFRRCEMRSSEVNSDDTLKSETQFGISQQDKGTLPHSNTPCTKTGPFSCDHAKMSIHLAGQLLNLTAVEFRLLSYLLHHPEITFTRDELLNQMYDDYRLVTDRTIDTHIKNLRRKTQQVIPSPEFIHSVYGVGYKLLIPSA